MIVRDRFPNDVKCGLRDNRQNELYTSPSQIVEEQRYTVQFRFSREF